jgi:hypothetical protein
MGKTMVFNETMGKPMGFAMVFANDVGQYMPIFRYIDVDSSKSSMNLKSV